MFLHICAIDMMKMEANLDDLISLLQIKRFQISVIFCLFLRSLLLWSEASYYKAEDVEGVALTTLIVNKFRGTFNVVGWCTRIW